MQSHDCANFGIKNAKKKKNGTIFMYLSQFDKGFSSFRCFSKVVLMPISAQHCQAEHFDCWKEFAMSRAQ